MKTSKLSRMIKKLALLIGVALLVVSIFLSYDGFDGSVNGANDGYAAVAVVIGIVFALAVTVIQFIFTNEYRQLNSTLIVVGIISYAYSIYTNKLGAQNMLGMNGWMAWFTAGMADIVAEPMISWGLGESLVGDLLGNLWKALGGEEDSRTSHSPRQSFKQGKRKKGKGGFHPISLPSETPDRTSRPPMTKDTKEVPEWLKGLK